MKPETFLSVFEAPLDPYDVPDVGDAETGDGKTPKSADHPLLVGDAAAAPKLAPIPIIPYTRPIQLGTIGTDVVGAKRAIWAANGIAVPTKATRLFGPLAVRQLKRFQSFANLTPDGVLGPETLRKLGPFFDRYAFLLYAGYSPGGSKEAKLRSLVVAYSLWSYNNRASIHYAQFRPMVHMNSLQHLPVWDDCSTRVTKAYKYAGAVDPNGMGYNGYGNTVTLRLHGHMVHRSNARPGDLVHYDHVQHVAVYVGNGLVVSHGSEIGPLLLPADYRPIREIRSYLTDNRENV